ncbi:MFS transporter [Aestuariimicrobium sp. T2.26MG-19.2B]|uniref:MFS transporter n=1 Tax=Aestuariimicrobium sp. T2.26MG-19.2B TaxID=3040679 RepID=UPI002477632A|nr:MFS transporter [Aestuariimicrobium sp. T2.26MG-19.2B]CAI9409682.1 Multidrug resistance protein Stp [Aestuariimicrobium sp. T2.26MG-19.2B]
MRAPDHPPRTAGELVEGVDSLAGEGLLDDHDLASEDGLPNRPHAGVVITIASLGFFLITLDISIVNVALARIRSELGGDITGQQWIIDGYTLVFAALLLFAGNLTDRVGAKRALALGISLFTVTSAACALAPSTAVLIAARSAQGAGAAIMLPASMALVREAFPDPARRARALGVWAVGGAVAGLVGQPLGGLLTTFDWRWVFTINLPVCVVMLGLLARVGASPKVSQPFDWPGQALGVIGLAALVHGLIEGGHAGFGSRSVVITLLVAAASLVGFVAVQAKVPHPMMPLDLFTVHGFRLALPVGFAFMVGNFGNVFVMALFLQQHLGLSPLQAGLVFLPPAFFSIVSNLVSGLVTNRYGARLPVVGGLLAMVVGLVAQLITAPLGLPWLMSICMIPIGAGGALAMPSVTSVVLEGVPAHRAGTASAVFNTFRQVGGAVAIAVFGALIAEPDHMVTGLRLSLGIAAALILLAALNSLRIRPRAQTTA